MSDAEVARDLHAALAKVRLGVEIVIEQDHRPVVVLKPSAVTRMLTSPRTCKWVSTRDATR